MKDWEDILKERLAGRKAELPESDWNDFLSRKASHELAVKRRRRILSAAISIPAAAAVLLLVFLQPFKSVVPDNQVAQNNQAVQNNPVEQPVIVDSVDVNPVESTLIPDNPENVNTVVKEAQPVKRIYAQEIKPEPQPELQSESEPEPETTVETSEEEHQNKYLIAQNHSVTGAIYDFDSAEPIYSAAVMIYQVNGADTMYVGGSATNDNGEFNIGNLEPGNYIASTRYGSLDDSYRNFTISPIDSTTDLGKITMRGNQGRLLSDLAVSAVVETVQVLNDTVRFNTAAYSTPEGSSVEDIIRKLPGVEIHDDGSITVNGKEVKRILVNGKKFFDDEKTVELKQLTADMIEKVKAYEKQSDLSRQTGIDDGREETVLDFSPKTVHIIDSIYISDTLFNRKGAVRVPIRKSKLNKYKDYLLELPAMQVYDDGIVTVNGVRARKIVFRKKNRIKVLCSNRYSVVYLPMEQ
jgi:hypothetical protein